MTKAKSNAAPNAEGWQEEYVRLVQHAHRQGETIYAYIQGVSAGIQVVDAASSFELLDLVTATGSVFSIASPDSVVLRWVKTG